MKTFREPEVQRESCTPMYEIRWRRKSKRCTRLGHISAAAAAGNDYRVLLRVALQSTQKSLLLYLIPQDIRCSPPPQPSIHLPTEFCKRSHDRVRCDQLHTSGSAPPASSTPGTRATGSRSREAKPLQQAHKSLTECLWVGPETRCSTKEGTDHAPAKIAARVAGYTPK